MIPSRSFPIIASSEDSTMADSSASCLSEGLSGLMTTSELDAILEAGDHLGGCRGDKQEQSPVPTEMIRGPVVKNQSCWYSACTYNLFTTFFRALQHCTKFLPGA